LGALVVRMPEEKQARLKILARARQVSVTKLIVEMATALLAEFDAETRFAIRSERGRGQQARGVALLAKASGKRHRRKS
jgi:hypothetical protein